MPADAISPAVSGLEAEALLYPEAMDTPEERKSFWSLLNISIGFFGIQFAWLIQMGQMSPLLERLGSAPWLTSILWCAGPVTGILVQPIVGSLSDRTWTRLGRRRPFLLVGAILTAISLIIMPNSPNLIVAASLLWVLDASINISQCPYRALVPDTVPRSQQAFAYTLMGFTIGLGSVAASLVGKYVPNMHVLFYGGSIAMLLAMGWTIFTTPETQRVSVEKDPSHAEGGLAQFFSRTWHSIATMPTDMKKLCVMHSFTWFGWQCLYMFFSLYVPHNIFGIPFGQSGSTPELENQIRDTIFTSYALLNAVCFIISPFLGKLAERVNNKLVHTIGLLCLAGAMIATFFITTPLQAIVLMGVIGVGWATTLSIPFAILSKQVPPGAEGVLMGTFNVFIALPQFIAAMLIGFLINYTHNYAAAMIAGGASVLISIFLLQFVQDKPVNAIISQ